MYWQGFHNLLGSAQKLREKSKKESNHAVVCYSRLFAIYLHFYTFSMLSLYTHLRNNMCICMCVGTYVCLKLNYLVWKGIFGSIEWQRLFKNPFINPCLPEHLEGTNIMETHRYFSNMEYNWDRRISDCLSSNLGSTTYQLRDLENVIQPLKKFFFAHLKRDIIAHGWLNCDN